MPLFRSCPFEDLVVKATDENNLNDDWALILEIVDKAVNYDEGPKLILQAITKRLYNNVPRVVVQALMLLDSCVKNCGKRFHLEVASKNFVTEVRKLLQKMSPTTVDKFKSLIKRWAEKDFKDDSELGLIPSLYYKLKSEGVNFPIEKVESKPLPPLCTNPDAVSSQEEEEDMVKAIAMSLKETKHSSNITDGSRYDFKALNEPIKVELLKVRAIYDFEAVEENELTIKAGEIIVVVDKSNESWWKGSNQRGEGYFPVSFVSEDLNAPVELIKNPEEPSEIQDEKMDEKLIFIDEQKIQKTLQILNDIDPTEDCTDENELLNLERECYAMSPLIDEKLQEIDKKCTVLNTLNEEIMKAIQSFHKLTRDGLAPTQFGYYYNFPPDSFLMKQPSQESDPSSFAGTAAIPPSLQKPAMSGNFYIPPNFLPNLAPLTPDQIRQNVVNLPFIHPQYLPIHYSMLAQKLNAGVTYASSEGPTFSNPMHTTAVPPSQGLTVNSRNSQNCSTNQKEHNAFRNMNELTLLDTENCAIMPQELPVPLNQNMSSSANGVNNSNMAPMVSNCSNELSSFQTQNYMNPCATTSAAEYSQNVSLNGTATSMTNVTSTLVPSNIPSNERLTENGVINQNIQ